MQTINGSAPGQGLVPSSQQQNQHLLSKNNLNGQDNTQAANIKYQNNNRISKGNLKDYGMNIITGGKTPVSSIPSASGTTASTKIGQMNPAENLQNAKIANSQSS